MSNQPTNQKLDGGVTQAEIDKWKKSHGTVNQIDILYDGHTYTCYLKKPDRNTVSFAMSKESADRILESGEIILENCWLGGDESIKENDDIWMAAAMRARTTFDLPEASVKKL